MSDIIDDLENYLEFQIRIGFKQIALPQNNWSPPIPEPESVQTTDVVFSQKDDDLTALGEDDPITSSKAANIPYCGSAHNIIRPNGINSERKPIDGTSELSSRAFDYKDKEALLENIRLEIGDCVRCPLHEGRRNIVFGEGNPYTELMFIGEGPGADEDREGRPFVGRAGQLLDKMIAAMTLRRSDVYIANIVKCRPPQNRNPLPVEIKTCGAFLEAQIRVIEPKVIIALGRVAAHTMLETKEPITSLRGKFRQRSGIDVMPTYHPAYLLRGGKDRRPKVEAWSDLQQVMSYLNLHV